MSFYNDSKLDESYTPQRISVRGGTDFHDLKELVMLEVEDLSGWTNIKLEDAPGRYADDNGLFGSLGYLVALRSDIFNRETQRESATSIPAPVCCPPQSAERQGHSHSTAQDFFHKGVSALCLRSSWF